jgi:hypothetical protein
MIVMPPDGSSQIPSQPPSVSEPEKGSGVFFLKIFWGVIALLVVVAIAAGAAYYFGVPFNDQNPFKRMTGSVTLLVRFPDGARDIETYSLADGTAVLTGVSADTITPDSTKVFTLKDGSVVTLDPAGIIKIKGGPKGPVSILIASTVPPTDRTPLAVWNDGEKIAWVNPADSSLQIFAKNSRGTYLPVYLAKDVKVSSLGFTEDGTILAFTTLSVQKSGEAATEISAVDLVTPTLTSVSTMNGFISIITL